MSEKRLLPKGWVDASLDAVGKLFCGQSPSVSDVNHNGEGTPYVTGPDQWDGSTLTLDKWTTNPKRLVPDGCIFITVKGAGVGKLFAGIACAIGRDVYAYKPAKDLSRKFIEHSLRYNISQILRYAKGDIPGLSKDHILGHLTSFPPLAEQRRIVAKIEELFSDLDAGIAALERAKANLKRYRASMLKAAVEGKLTESWRVEHSNTEPASKLLERILAERRQKWEADQLAKFASAGKEPPKNWRDKYVDPSPPDTTDLPELPDGWCWATVEQLGSVQLGRQRSPKNRSNEYPTKYIRAANLTEAGLDLSDVLDMEFVPGELETYRLLPGDVLLSEASGSPDQVGKPVVWNGEIENCCFQNTVIRLRPVGMPSYFPLTVFRHYYRSKLFAKVSAGVGINHLSAGKFSALRFPLAPLAEQEQIVAEVEQRLSMIAATETEIDHNLRRATRLRQSILKQAFEGKLVRQDPNDEPASELLARLGRNECQSIE
jgi:type I restriction enzyme S subunit